MFPSHSNDRLQGLKQNLWYHYSITNSKNSTLLFSSRFDSRTSNFFANIYGQIYDFENGGADGVVPHHK